MKPKLLTNMVGCLVVRQNKWLLEPSNEIQFKQTLKKREVRHKTKLVSLLQQPNPNNVGSQHLPLNRQNLRPTSVLFWSQFGIGDCRLVGWPFVCCCCSRYYDCLLVAGPKLWLTISPLILCSLQTFPCLMILSDYFAWLTFHNNCNDTICLIVAEEECMLVDGPNPAN